MVKFWKRCHTCSIPGCATVARFFKDSEWYCSLEHLLMNVEPIELWIKNRKLRFELIKQLVGTDIVVMNVRFYMPQHSALCSVVKGTEGIIEYCEFIGVDGEGPPNIDTDLIVGCGW